jgi:hypothetical protein
VCFWEEEKGEAESKNGNEGKKPLDCVRTAQEILKWPGIEEQIKN